MVQSVFEPNDDWSGQRDSSKPSVMQQPLEFMDDPSALELSDELVAVELSDLGVKTRNFE